MLSCAHINIFCFVFITIDQIKALNFYFYIKTTFWSLLHLQVKDYTNLNKLRKHANINGLQSQARAKLRKRLINVSDCVQL